MAVVIGDCGCSDRITNLKIIQTALDILKLISVPS